jgi:molybdopterin synthase sulfur carrier subunit
MLERKLLMVLALGVTVKFFANFREAVGQEQVEIAAANVAALLDELVGRFGERMAEQLYEPSSKKLRETVNVLVNGRGINLLSGLDTKLKDGDVVAIFPPVSGGI